LRNFNTGLTEIEVLAYPVNLSGVPDAENHWQPLGDESGHP
jgi:hypothetical protein